MKSTHARLSLLSLAAALATPAYAQSNRDVPIEYVAVRNWVFSLGYRSAGGAATVKFGNLGNIARSAEPGAATGNISRLYDDGLVAVDTRRTDETAAGTVDDPANPATRYNVSSLTGSGNFLKFQEGQTRIWAYNNASQVTPDGQAIAMNSYAVTSQGATAEADSGGGGGVELQLGRVLGRIGTRMEWGVNAAMGITDINAKTSGTVAANLDTITDLYSLNGMAAPTAPYNAAGTASGGIFETTTLEDGTTFTRETTVPLALVPFSRTQTTTANGAQVNGNWQTKGAYYMVRVGPTVRIKFGERFAISAGAGGALAYIGTTYRVTESATIGGLADAYTVSEEQDANKLLFGFYGEVNAEYWLTERTGFYAGATFESLGDYEQSLRGRTAKIDLGSGVGIRFGITTRF